MLNQTMNTRSGKYIDAFLIQFNSSIIILFHFHMKFVCKHLKHYCCASAYSCYNADTHSLFEYKIQR